MKQLSFLVVLLSVLCGNAALMAMDTPPAPTRRSDQGAEGNCGSDYALVSVRNAQSDVQKEKGGPAGVEEHLVTQDGASSPLLPRGFNFKNNTFDLGDLPHDLIRHLASFMKVFKDLTSFVQSHPEVSKALHTPGALRDIMGPALYEKLLGTISLEKPRGSLKAMPPAARHWGNKYVQDLVKYEMTKEKADQAVVKQLGKMYLLCSWLSVRGIDVDDYLIDHDVIFCKYAGVYPTNPNIDIWQTAFCKGICEARHDCSMKARADASISIAKDFANRINKWVESYERLKDLVGTDFIQQLEGEIAHQGYDVNFYLPHNSRSTLLHDAIHRNKPEEAAALVKYGADIFQCNVNSSALAAALNNNNAALARALSSPQIDESYEKQYKKYWNFDSYEILIDNIAKYTQKELDDLVQSEAKILHALIAHKHKLEKEGVSVFTPKELDEFNQANPSLLMELIQTNQTTKTVKLPHPAIGLIERISPQYLNLTDKHGLTPLSWAAWNDLKEVGLALVKKMCPAQLVKALNDGTLFLYWACHKGNEKILGELAKKVPAARLNQIRIGSNTFLMHAVVKRVLPVTHDILEVLTVNQLKGMDFGGDGHIIFHYLKNNELDLALKLIERHPVSQLNMVDSDGNTLLHIVARYHYQTARIAERLVDVLTAEQCVVRNKKDKTSLDFAMSTGKYDLVAKMVSKLSIEQCKNIKHHSDYDIFMWALMNFSNPNKSAEIQKIANEIIDKLLPVGNHLYRVMHMTGDNSWDIISKLIDKLSCEQCNEIKAFTVHILFAVPIAGDTVGYCKNLDMAKRKILQKLIAGNCMGIGEDGLTYLHRAIYRAFGIHNISNVLFLIEELPAELCNQANGSWLGGNTSLHEAARANITEIALPLIEKLSAEQCNIKNGSGKAALELTTDSKIRWALRNKFANSAIPIVQIREIYGNYEAGIIAALRYQGPALMAGVHVGALLLNK